MLVMIKMDDYFEVASQAHRKKEKEKARQMRQTQWWRQQLGKGSCYYCKEEFPKEDLTMDHLTPISRGGRTTKKNVVVCCKDCNSKKKYHTTGELALQKLKANSKL